MHDTSTHDPHIDDRVDFGRTADDYARYRAGFPARFYDALVARGVGLPGQRVVDVGTGTGTVARALAARGCVVTGVDIAAPLLAQAARLAAGDSLDVTWREASAEDTGLPASSFDAVVASQCWHWFDRPRAAAEARRLLAPGGRVVIAHLDWLALAGNVVDDTLAVIHEHRQAPWPLFGDPAGNGIYPLWPADLTTAGFADLELFGFDVALPYSHEAWRGRMRASAGVGATMDAAQIARCDAAMARMLAARHPDPVAVPHRVFALLGTAP